MKLQRFPNVSTCLVFLQCTMLMNWIRGYWYVVEICTLCTLRWKKKTCTGPVTIWIVFAIKSLFYSYSSPWCWSLLSPSNVQAKANLFVRYSYCHSLLGINHVWVNVFIGSCPCSKVFSRLSSFPPSTKIILPSSKFDPENLLWLC